MPGENVIELPSDDAALRSLLAGVEAEQREAVAAHLGGERRTERLASLVDDSHARFDRQLRRLPPPPRKLACKAGCAWCCHGVVQTSAPEALRIVAHLRATLRGEQLGVVKQSIARLDDRARAAGPAAAARLPCPLLAGNRCSVYPVRPLACRAWNSFDVSRCREDLLGKARGQVPVYRLQLALQAAVGAGLDAGLSEHGLGTAVLELAPTLRRAFEPRAAERWLAGEPVFDT